MNIGFVTCNAKTFGTFFPTAAEPHLIPTEPLFTPDDQLAVDELRRHGFVVQPIVWGCAIATLHHFDAIIVRSPWDYMDSDKNKSRFLAWIHQLEEAGLLVLNPAHFMQWMLDKHYLKHLQAQDVQTISTDYYEMGASLNLLEQFETRGQFVIKPCISAAGIGLFHIKTADDANRFQHEVNQRIQHCGYLLQDFVEEITTHGEWSLVFLGGIYSHAVHKKPAEGSILVHAERGGSLHFAQPPKHIIQFAMQAAEKILPAYEEATDLTFDPELLLYLRFDIIDADCGPLLIECEAVEPELFFRARPASVILFSETVVKILQKIKHKRNVLIS